MPLCTPKSKGLSLPPLLLASSVVAFVCPPLGSAWRSLVGCKFSVRAVLVHVPSCHSLSITRQTTLGEKKEHRATVAVRYFAWTNSPCS